MVQVSFVIAIKQTNHSTGFFRISGKTGSQIRIFFSLKPSQDQDGADKKKFSQIGPAVPEEIGREHTYIHTRKHPTAI